MSNRIGVNLPTFDWARVLRRLAGLIAVVHPDGQIVAVSGRLYDDDPDVLFVTHVMQLASELDRDRLAVAIQTAASEQRSVALTVASRADRHRYAVEISPDGAGSLVMVWVAASVSDLPLSEDDVDLDAIATPMAAVDRGVAPPRRLVEVPGLTSAPVAPPSVGAPTTPLAPQPVASEPAAQPAGSPPPGLPRGDVRSPEPARDRTASLAITTTLTPETRDGGSTSATPDYVICAPQGLRRLAGRLQRAIDLITPRSVVWFAEEFDTKMTRLSNTTRVMFLGPSKYADFLRPLVRPQYEAAGAAWGTMERKVLFWVSEEGDEGELRKLLDAAVSKAARISLSRAVAGPGEEMPSGKELAGKFLNEPSPTRPGLIELRYLLAVSMFFLDGFAAYHPAPPKPPKPGPAKPGPTRGRGR